MITDNLQRLLNECIMIEDGNYLGGKFSVNLKDCQNELDEIKQNSHKHGVMQAEAEAGAEGAAVGKEREAKGVSGRFYTDEEIEQIKADYWQKGINAH